jgi:hypothetical protein
VPTRRGPITITRNGFGAFDATLEPRGPAPGGRGGYLCALRANVKVKFDFARSATPWPPGTSQSWVQRFVRSVAQHWSTRYLLVPNAPCANEGCTSTVVYASIEPVTSGQHHTITMDYVKPGGARSNSGHFYNEDLNNQSQRGAGTAMHEAGHLFGLAHIHCSTNADDCYGTSYGEADDVMGRGAYVSARDYAPFAEAATQLSGCTMRVPEGQGGAHDLSFTAPLTILGAAIGGVLGAGLGASLGVGTAIGVGIGGAALFGGLGALVGYLIDHEA